MTFASLVSALFVALAILTSASGYGLYFLRRLRVQASRADNLFLAFGLGLGLVSWAMLILGLAAAWYPIVAYLLVGGGLVCGLLARPDVRSFSIRTCVQPALAGIRSWQNWPHLALFLIGAGSAAWVFLTHTLMPPFEWDEISYHLALIKIYIQNHQIIYVPDNVSSNWPLHVNMVYGLTLMLGSDIAHHVINWSMALVTAWGLYLVAARRLSHRAGILAFALYLSIPLVKRLSGTGLIDIPFGLYSLTAFYAFIKWQEIHDFPWLALVGLFSGFAMATKVMGAVFPVFFGLLWLWEIRREWRTRLPEILRQGSALVGLAVLTAGPWYLRSYLYTGNPLWPFLYGLFGGKNWDWLGDQYHNQLLAQAWSIHIPLTPRGFLLSIYYVIFKPLEVGAYPGGIGILTPILALAATPLLLRAPRWVRQGYLISAVFYLLWFVLLSRQVRYLTPIFPLLCLLAAFTFEWVWNRLKVVGLRSAFVLVLAAYLFLDFPFLEHYQQGLFLYRWKVTSGQLTRAQFLDQQVKIMPAVRFANKHLAADAYILLLPFENRCYYLDRAYFWGNPISQRVIRWEQYNSPAEVAELLRSMGITHILDSPAWLFESLQYWKHDRALMLALEEECARPIFSQENAFLYELTACQPSATLPVASGN